MIPLTEASDFSDKSIDLSTLVRFACSAE